MEIGYFDLFCGAGGLTSAFESVGGFKLLGGLDYDENAIATFNFNFQNKGTRGSIEERQVREEVVAKIESFDGPRGVIGGAPCQSYSLAGNRDVLEKRAYYYIHFFDIVSRTRPDFFVFENVRGLQSMNVISPEFIDMDTMEVNDVDLRNMLAAIRRMKDLKRFGAQRELESDENKEVERLKQETPAYHERIKKYCVPLLLELEKRAKNAGYLIKHAIMNGKDYGSPQSRERFIMVGIRNDHGFYFQIPRKEQVNTSIKAVLADLESFEELRGTMNDEELQRFLEENGVFNHVFTRHSPDIIARIACLPQGQNLYKNYSDAWWRMTEDGISRCVKENHNGCHIHYRFNRVATPRELARLQGFPDSFKFIGTKSATLKMIGNAVDKHLGVAVANQIKKCFQGRN